MKTLLNKLKEATFSTLPVMIIVLILSFTPLINLEAHEIVLFVISSIFLILGVALFSLGADLAMNPIGETIGSNLSKKKKLFILLLAVFLIGVLVTIAEPDLQILGQEVKSIISPILLVVLVGLGVGVFMVLAVIRIIHKKPLNNILMIMYLIVFCLACLLVINGKEILLPLSFDSGGVTTGPMTVPLIMSLGVGISTVLSGRKAKENSFGFVSLASIGPLIAIMLLCLFSKNELNYAFSSYEPTGSFISYIFKNLLNSMSEVAIALILVTIFFLVCNKFFIKLKKKKLTKILIGLLYTFVGLTMFLTACKVGFMSIGFKIGKDLSKYSDFVLITVGFIMGVLVVLAEPSVHVLVNQVEHITGGYVKKKEILISLSFGVGISLALSIIRNIYGFSIMYYLIPGYILSLALSFFIPPIYTAIAFDSGGVASGPMTSSFILPFAIGITIQKYGEAFVLNNAFGIVAMVAMTPLITIQVLGFKAIVTNKVKKEIAMRKILSSDDSQIISFI